MHLCVRGKSHYLSVLQVNTGAAAPPVLIISNKFLIDQLTHLERLAVPGHMECVSFADDINLDTILNAWIQQNDLRRR